MLTAENGSVEVTDQFRGDTATYTCNSGFELLDLTSGSDMRTCQPNGTWTSPEPQCLGMSYTKCYLISINTCNSSV